MREREREREREGQRERQRERERDEQVTSDTPVNKQHHKEKKSLRCLLTSNKESV